MTQIAGPLFGAVLAVCAALLSGCEIEGGREADKARAVNQALNGGPKSDWAAAAAAARRYARSKADGDAEAGSLLLRSLADPTPATRPSGTAEDAYRLMESGAAHDPDRNIPILESFLRFGVSAPRSDHVIIPPDITVADCWSRVSAHKGSAAACIMLRRKSSSRPT